MLGLASCTIRSPLLPQRGQPGEDRGGANGMVEGRKTMDVHGKRLNNRVGAVWHSIEEASWRCWARFWAS